MIDPNEIENRLVREALREMYGTDDVDAIATALAANIVRAVIAEVHAIRVEQRASITDEDNSETRPVVVGGARDGADQ